MSPGERRMGAGRGPFGRGWRVLSKFQLFLLWSGGVYLGCNLVLIAWGLDDGRPVVRMLSPIVGAVLALLLPLQALWWSRLAVDSGKQASSEPTTLRAGDAGR